VTHLVLQAQWAASKAATKTKDQSMETVRKSMYHHMMHSSQSNGLRDFRSSKLSTWSSSQESGNLWSTFSNSRSRAKFAKETPTSFPGKSQSSLLTAKEREPSSRRLVTTGHLVQRETSTKSIKSSCSSKTTLIASLKRQLLSTRRPWLNSILGSCTPSS